MPITDRYQEQLEEIQEQNRLFLAYLKHRLRSDQHSMGLSAAIRAALTSATSAELDAAAEFPRALFRFRLEAWTPWQLNDPQAVVIDPAGQSLQVALLVSACNLCRRNHHAARFFLGLSDSEVRRLRATALSELHRYALTAVAVTCAFAGLDWLWLELLRETRSDVRRQLLLVGLQPELSAGPDMASHTGRRLLR